MKKKINNPRVKIYTNPFGMWASLKTRCHWAMYGNKHVLGKIYRYFYTKRLMKRILLVSNIIAERSIRGQDIKPVEFMPMTYVGQVPINNFNIKNPGKKGIVECPVIGHKESLIIKPEDIPIFVHCL